jgi:hypothetical protein
MTQLRQWPLELGSTAGRTYATDAPCCLPLVPLICVASRGSVVGIEWGNRGSGGLATLKIWQASYVAGVLTATWLTAIYQIVVSRPGVATPNARVADAFSATPLNVTTALTSALAALPPPVLEAKFDIRSSANAIVAAEFSDVAPDAVMPSDVNRSLRQGLMLQARGSVDAAPPENEATSYQGGPPAAPPNPDEGELPYLKYYVYSEIPPPEKPAKIALAAFSDVALGTPV